MNISYEVLLSSLARVALDISFLSRFSNRGRKGQRQGDQHHVARPPTGSQDIRDALLLDGLRPGKDQQCGGLVRARIPDVMASGTLGTPVVRPAIMSPTRRLLT
jgi:hypothetical protein